MSEDEKRIIEEFKKNQKEMQQFIKESLESMRSPLKEILDAQNARDERGDCRFYCC